MTTPLPHQVRTLVVVLGDQLDHHSAALQDFDPEQDAVWMCEATGEATEVWSHQARIAIFLTAMRHFAAELGDRGLPVRYRAMSDHGFTDLLDALVEDIEHLRPDAVRLLEPGEWRLAEGFGSLETRTGVPVEVLEDQHFLCSRTEFAGWLEGRTAPRMEHFYRWMRRRTGYLMEGGKPTAGRWNFDEENRGSFGPDGPGMLVDPLSFAPDPITLEVLELVRTRFGEHPGSLASFDWPVTRAEALTALTDFVDHRLVDFGRYQDAMASGVPWPGTLLFHSRLSAAMNLKLIDPREVCDAVLAAYHAGNAPLAAVEGFLRQIIGWREYVRGLYWSRMPEFEHANALAADEPLPSFYWDGQTEMNCLRLTIEETLAHGYAHHIQRLMVTGLFALLVGVSPVALHRWYLAVYVDAVEWVELPNTIGMSQYADGGFLASKPYVATGKYLDRMSDYCGGCRFNPAQATGSDACPFTTQYWDFLGRHRERFAAHPRMALQIKNLNRKSAEELDAIAVQAAGFRTALRSS